MSCETVKDMTRGAGHSFVDFLERGPVCKVVNSFDRKATDLGLGARLTAAMSGVSPSKFAALTLARAASKTEASLQQRRDDAWAPL